jgi:putative Mn2+ efflux pump MntP
MTALLLAALAVGIDNFAVAISLGLGVVDARSRLLITTVFGLFEAGMPLLGLLLGNRVAHGLGGTAADVGGALLIAMGAWTALQNHRGNHAGHEPVSVGSARQGHYSSRRSPCRSTT